MTELGKFPSMVTLENMTEDEKDNLFGLSPETQATYWMGKAMMYLRLLRAINPNELVNLYRQGDISERINCDDCRFYQPTGRESYYIVGNCNHPTPQLGGAMVGWKGIAGWLSCWQARRKRGERVVSGERESEA